MPRRRDYLLRSARRSLQFDWAMLRGLSAVRRVAILAAAFAAGAWWWGESAGYFLAIGAVFGGFFDRGDTSTHVAARGTFALAGTSVAVGALTALLAVSDVAAVLVVAACAAASGVASAVSMTAARVLAFTAVLGIANVVAPNAVTAALQASLLIGLGVLAQAVGTGLADVVGGDRIERRRLAQALAAVASALRESARPETVALQDPQALTSALTSAETMVDTWNLPSGRAESFTEVLQAAHDLRVEAIAGARRHASEAAAPTAQPATLTAAARVLVDADRALRARALTRGRLLRRLRASLTDLPGPDDAWQRPPDRLVVAAARTVGTDCLALAHPCRSGGTRPSRPTPMRVDLRRGLSPRSIPGRHALRLALVTVLSAVAAIFVDDTHSYWIAITAIIVLRPDIPSTSVRTIGRVIGTLSGAVVVVALALAVGAEPVRLAVVAVPFALIAYMFQMVNYAAFVFGLVGVIVMLTAIPSGDPVTVATARVLDVLAGSVLAVLASRLIPIWTTSNLPRCLADYSRRSGEWLASFATDLSDGVLRPESNERPRQVTRASAQRLRAAMATADAEPQDPRVDIELVHAIEAATTGSVRLALAAVASMREAPRADLPAAGCARRASAELLEAARDIEQAQAVVPVRAAQEVGPGAARPSDADSELHALMSAAEREARRALALARTARSSSPDT